MATVGEARQQHVLTWERHGLLPNADTSRGEVRVAGVRPDRPEPGGGSPLQADPPPDRVTSVEPLIMAGDLTEDGYVPIERPDGTKEPIFVKASATYRATGLVPGERATVRLGTNRAPNLAPVAHYTAEAIVDELVPDVMGEHHGERTDRMDIAGMADQANDWFVGMMRSLMKVLTYPIPVSAGEAGSGGCRCGGA